jgi:hypothetical protein
MAIVARAHTPRMLAAVSASSHHMQWNKASFKIPDEEGCFYLNSLKIGMAR